jgi:uncharacterized protein (TIGR02231 family)
MSENIIKRVEKKEDFDYTPGGRIKDVLLYQDRATITRQIPINVKEGENTIVIENLSPVIDRSTIKMLIPDALKSKIEVLGIQTKDKSLAYIPKEEERQIHNEIIQETIKLIEEYDNESILNIERSLIEELSEYVSKATNQVVMDKEILTNKLTEVLKFINSRNKSTHKELYDTLLNKEDINERLNILIKQLNYIRTPVVKNLVDVNVKIKVSKLNNEQSINDEIGLSYSVRNIKWRTSYDARLIETQDTTYKVKLTCYANITQRTGEDWENVKISLTTAKPSSAQIPDIYPAYLEAHKRKVVQKTLQSSEEQIEDSFYFEGEEAEAPLEEDLPESESTPPGERLEPVDKPSYSEVSESTINKTYHLDGMHTVLSNGDAHTLTIFETELSTSLTYETVPKIVEYVYLKGRIKNDTAYPFLSGKLNIIRKSGYVGSGTMNYVAPGESFDMSFGIDEDVKIRRICVLDDLKKDKVGFNQHRYFGYDIELKSFKDKSELVSIKENIPVSELKEVKVRLKDKTTKGYELDEKEGIVEWKVNINKGEKKHFLLYYEIEAPKSFNLKHI